MGNDNAALHQLANKLTLIADLLAHYEPGPDRSGEDSDDTGRMIARQFVWDHTEQLMACVDKTRELAKKLSDPEDLIRKAQVVLQLIADRVSPDYEAHRMHEFYSLDSLVDNLADAATHCMRDVEKLAAELCIVASESEAPPPPPARFTKMAQAIQLASKHPDWTLTKIAGVVEVNRTTFYTPGWKAFLATYRQSKQSAPPPRGSKDIDGNMEAVDET